MRGERVRGRVRTTTTTTTTTTTPAPEDYTYDDYDYYEDVEKVLEYDDEEYRYKAEQEQSRKQEQGRKQGQAREQGRARQQGREGTQGRGKEQGQERGQEQERGQDLEQGYGYSRSSQEVNTSYISVDASPSPPVPSARKSPQPCNQWLEESHPKVRNVILMHAKCALRKVCSMRKSVENFKTVRKSSKSKEK